MPKGRLDLLGRLKEVRWFESQIGYGLIHNPAARVRADPGAKLVIMLISKGKITSRNTPNRVRMVLFSSIREPL